MANKLNPRYVGAMALAATFRPSRPTGGPIGPGHFCDLFDETCRRQAEQTAIIDGDRRLTFGTWARASNMLAAGLAQRGVCPGDVVAFQLPNWWETCVVFTAIARLGAIANPLLPILRERELTFILRQSGARYHFIPGAYRGTDYRALILRTKEIGTPVESVFAVRGAAEDDFAHLTAQGEDPPAVSVAAGDLLLLMYTSGTTANPKGVLHTNETLVAEVLSLRRVHALAAGDTTLVPSPLTHISGLLHGIMVPAILGTTAVLMDRWDPSRATELIARERVTYMVGAPIFLQDLLAVGGAESWARSLRLFSCGGASVSAELMRRAHDSLGCVAKRVYGSTEFPTVTTTSPGDAQTRAIETEGLPIPPNEIRVVDEAGNPPPAGEPGEIHARGPECFVGYVDSAMNADAFTADGWFRTGDIGVIDSDGYLTLTGRIKEIVIRKGEKISIREIEELLLLHPAIRETCVVGVADDEVGERLCVALELEAGSQLSAADVAAHLRTQGLALQKLPERVAFTQALPRTESGKVHRAAVVALFERTASAKRD